jgi:hypothetical protein
MISFIPWMLDPDRGELGMRWRLPESTDDGRFLLLECGGKEGPIRGIGTLAGNLR